MTKISSTSLTPGAVVLTTCPVGKDFEIPVVEPWRRKRTAAIQRIVRSHCRTGAGVVVWFTDGTKSVPLHGRSAWQEA